MINVDPRTRPMVFRAPPATRRGWLRGRPIPAVAVAFALASAAACGPRAGDPLHGVEVQDGKIVVVVGAIRDSVFAAASHVLVQEGIPLRIYSPGRGIVETGFFNIGAYRVFDPEIWDETERLVKLRFSGAIDGGVTTLVCEPLYNPHEVFTDESDRTRLLPVPPGHPGFDIAAMLTRRIAARAEKRAVAGPS